MPAVGARLLGGNEGGIGSRCVQIRGRHGGLVASVALTFFGEDETVALGRKDMVSAVLRASQSRRKARLVAFYLPQFHPIPENDRWWGKGFTEWTNVARARPLFRGHGQPHVPADLGFYDLRVPELRSAQAELARNHGIEAFCYWHYWFSGKRLLGRPFDEVLASGEPDFPFCLAWANEAWTRTWLGNGQMLQDQTYSVEDDERHARWLAAAFSDERYLRIRGRPAFLVYRPTHLPNPRRTTDTIRRECVKLGLSEPYLIGINADCPTADCRVIGFDATLDFEPQLGDLPDYNVDGPTLSKLRRNLSSGVGSGRLRVYDYAEARNLMARRRRGFNFPFYPSIVVRWDSTPRRGHRGIVFLDSTPDRFESGLASLVRDGLGKPLEDRLIWVNAWNEWAEGNHLEPDVDHGLAYLSVVKHVVETRADDTIGRRAEESTASS